MNRAEAIEKLHKLYHSVDTDKSWETLRDFLYLIFNTKIKRHFPNEEDHQDFFSDLLEEVIQCHVKKLIFQTPEELFQYLVNFIRNRLRVKDIEKQSSQSLEITGLSEVLLHNTYGYRQFMIRLYLQDVIKILSIEFERSLRFIGKERKICLAIFDSLLKDAEIKVEFLEKRYNLKADFYIQHVKVLIRKILYQLRALGYADLSYLMEG